MISPLHLHNGPKRVATSDICPASSGDFMKGHIISPDGSQVLLSSESNYISCWNMGEAPARTLYYRDSGRTQHAAVDDGSLEMSSVFNMGESIYDYAWHPYIDPSTQRASIFVCTTKDHPVHMMDLETGGIRCSYLGHNHLDELDPAFSVAFNIDATKIYTGGNRVIRCFDVDMPGKNCTDIATSRSRRDKTGQKGIISCLSFNPDRSGCFAAGSYDRSMGVYDEVEHECVLQLTGLDFGVTCSRWSPCGNFLWMGGRKNDNVVCYDLRHTRKELGRVSRSLSTNQRMVFSLDPWGKYLATGNDTGSLLVYDATTFEEVHSSQQASAAINSVSFHPFSSLIVASTGQRVFPSDDDDDGKVNIQSSGEQLGTSSSEASEIWSQLILFEVECKDLNAT